MVNGWICLHRSIQDHWIWQDPIKLKWWIDILISVNHEGKKVNIGLRLIECNRGQSVLSLSNWAKRWNVSKDTVRNFFTLLKNDNMIAMENLTKTTRITVCNYDIYQDSLHDNQTDGKHNPNATYTQTTMNNNDNNISTNVDSLNTGDSDHQKAEKINYKELLNSYHSICVSLPEVKKLTDSRKNKIRIRIREIEKQFKDTKYILVLNDLFSKMESSDFMKGSNTRNWRASLDWLFENSENWVKVLEGKYDNRSDNLRDQEFVNNLLGKGGCQTYIIPDDGPKSEYKYINGKLTLVVD